MILKKTFHPLAVLRYMRTDLSISVATTLLVFFLHQYQWLPLTLPFSIVAILGSALAIFLAFRNNNSYSRWWEARTLWGGIINSSRIFARQIIANADNAMQTGKATPELVAAFKKEMIDRQIAFAHALRLQLRQQHDYTSLQHLLNEQEYAMLNQQQNAANMLLLSQGKRIKDAMRAELLGAFDNISLEPTLASFNNYQGSCERIKNTPLLRQYHYFTRLFLLSFMLLLPVALIGEFQKMGMPWLMMPVSILLAFVFGVMGKVGEVNEDPFENKITDLPLTAMCNTIERDLKEMLGEALPEKTPVSNGFLM